MTPPTLEQLFKLKHQREQVYNRLSNRKRHSAKPHGCFGKPGVGGRKREMRATRKVNRYIGGAFLPHW